MKNILQIELKRAFINKGFLIALLTGLMICLWHFFEYIFPCVFDSSIFIGDGKSYFPPSSYNWWIGGNYVPIQSYLYFLILPIFATIPYGNSYIVDEKIGLLKNIFIRTQKGKYLLSKYIAVFLSGAVAVVVPLIVNFYLTALVLPSILPDTASGNSVVYSNFKWGDIFYTKPLLFILLHILIVFVFSGFIATIALALSSLINNRYVVIFAPMIIYVFLSSLADITQINELNLMGIINPTQGYGSTAIVIIYSVVLFIFTFVPFYCYGVKKDAL